MKPAKIKIQMRYGSSSPSRLEGLAKVTMTLSAFSVLTSLESTGSGPLEL